MEARLFLIFTTTSRIIPFFHGLAFPKSFELGIRGVDPNINPDFSTTHYEFALGIALRNLIAGSASPQEAAAMAQAVYDAPSVPNHIF